MKLLVDQMWPAILAEQLRHRGHDVVAVVERHDLLHAADDVVFDAASQEERAVFTENVGDYLPLANARLGRGEAFFGLVLTSDRGYPRGHPSTIGRAVLALDQYMTAHPASAALRNRIDWLPTLDEPD